MRVSVLSTLAPKIVVWDTDTAGCTRAGPARARGDVSMVAPRRGSRALDLAPPRSLDVASIRLRRSELMVPGDQREAGTEAGGVPAV